MNKAEAVAYLRKKQLLEQREAVSLPTVTEETEEELRHMEEKLPEHKDPLDK